MRLLHVHTLKVKEFNNDKDRPPYAILSHTWEDGEVSFQDIQTPEAASMAGYAKVLKSCEITKRDGFDYVWIDACCIDKTSSTELSEAINSMFKWYRAADVCYVYLSDLTQDDMDSHMINPNIDTCRWFTRGWTLQELLAPEVVVFCNKDWVDIGTKRTLQKAISRRTGIPCEALLDADHIRKVSIAARMSWASYRDTTRVEDEAYCLMGIFDVNMPPLYGEGDKAFRRLQLEIIKNSRDESIFAWTVYGYIPWETEIPYMGERRRDMLASCPQDFEYCQGVTCKDQYQSKPPFSISNKGLHIWLPSIRTTNGSRNDVHLSGLNCILADGKQIFIALDLLPNSGDYTRLDSAAYTVERDDLNTMDHPIEMYIVGQDPTNGIVFPSRYSMFLLTSKFHFVENTSPETGYHIDSFYYAGKIGRGPEVPPNRTFVFGGVDYNYVGLMYVGVSSIQDPSVQATIALGVVHKADTKQYKSKTTYHCRIFAGTNLPSHTSGFNEKKGNQFSEVFPSRTTFQYFPSDKIVRRVRRGYVVTVTVRTGPMKKSAEIRASLYNSPLDHHYRVDITFSRPAWYTSNEILEAEITLDNGSTKPPEEIQITGRYGDRR